MICFIKGILKNIEQNSLIIEISGLGFQISVPEEKYFEVGKEVELHISFVWNQETGPHLYGFRSNLEKNIFDLVISCSGCGPKIGLAVLSTMSPAIFLSSIASADVKALSKINGIGSKKAESIILQLKDKINKFELYKDKIDTKQTAHFEKLKDVNQALESLGYSRFEINNAISQINGQVDISVAKFDEILRKALSFLSKKN